jgi:DNA-binding response OmpR family regulator
MKVLLVEDSERLRRTVSTGLRRAGYAVDTAGNGTDGLWYASGSAYDVIVLDLMLPGMDGLSLLRELRSRGGEGANAQVLILTAKDTIADRVSGLRTGADDYLIKPFSFDELLARVEALTRRRHGVKQTTLSIGDLLIDTVNRTVTRGGTLIELSSREFALLHYLALHAGQVVSRSEIEQHLYEDRAEIMSNVVDAAVYVLRKRLDRPGEPSLIQTRRGLGYVLNAGSRAADSESPAPAATVEARKQ